MSLPLYESKRTELHLVASEIAKRLQEGESLSGSELDERDIWRVKLEVCRKHRIDRIPKNSEILDCLDSSQRSAFLSRLRRKKIRSISGIAVITAITRPFNCPHGTCTFCPGGVPSGTPQSYTKNSPAAAFGSARDYDPHRQVCDMLNFLNENGHDTSKIELILLGGTILAMPQRYQTDFVKSCYEALTGKQTASLEDAISENERASHRCVGLTIETKPDWCRANHVDTLLSYGATRVEIGVQSLRNEVLQFANRGHTINDTINAFRTSKDSSFKIVAHMMPGLPKSDPDKDLQDLTKLLEDEDYRPDMLKIYPTLVVEGTALHKQFQLGHYKPYNIDQLIEILCKFKTNIPPWIRIMRIQREIPKEEIAEGTRAGNLRQIVLEEMARRNLTCRCIRCREVGHRVESTDHFGNIILSRTDYKASLGEEIFLSFEDQSTSTLFGFLRLRIPSGSEHRPEIKDQRAALVRELHVYGPVVPIGEKWFGSSQAQHRGLGSSLLLEAEKISREYSRKKLVVISAVGTREYYRKRGYANNGAFVSKSL